MVPAASDSLSRVESYSGYRSASDHVAYGAFTLCCRPFQGVRLRSRVLNAVLQPHRACPVVWANPLSLAATDGIDFSFSSSRYLDVSVPWVRIGYSGIRTRLTAPPDFSQSSTPYSLLVPRHPPHALNSLARLLTPSRRVATPVGPRTTRFATPRFDPPGFDDSFALLRPRVENPQQSVTPELTHTPSRFDPARRADSSDAAG